MSDPSLLNIPYRFKAGTLYSQIPESGLGDFVVSRTTTPTANRSTRVNAQGFIETVADNVPRLDYPLGGIAAGCPALLVEPAATNQIRNNTMVGAVAGTPGTLPTNHSTTLNGLTRTIVGVGSENGVDYIDVQVSGTATGSVFLYAFETPTQIVAASGQAWTNSMWIKQVADVGGNRPPARLTMYEYTAAGAYVTEGSAPVTLTSSLTRFSFTRTLTGATTARATPIVQFFLNVGITYNFTIRIGLPQMELGSVATSVIPTTTQAITRGADLVSKTGVSSLIGQTEGTIYAEVDIRAFANVGMIASISDGTNNNRLEIYKFTDSKIYFDRISATQSALTSVGSNALTAGIFKIAVAYKSGDTTMYINGAQVGTTQTQTFTFASMPKINIGTSRADINQFNDRIRASALHPTRLTNTQLQALTT
jgi:hypothetical protein